MLVVDRSHKSFLGVPNRWSWIVVISTCVLSAIFSSAIFKRGYFRLQVILASLKNSQFVSDTLEQGVLRVISGVLQGQTLIESWLVEVHWDLIKGELDSSALTSQVFNLTLHTLIVEVLYSRARRIGRGWLGSGLLSWVVLMIICVNIMSCLSKISVVRSPLIFI